MLIIYLTVNFTINIYLIMLYNYNITLFKQSKIYYLSLTGIKKWIPTTEIFNSYGNKWPDIQVISKKEIDSYKVSNVKSSADHAMLFQEKPKETFLNSTKINDNLFPLFEKHQVKVIFSSTSEVYGETKNRDGSKETDHLEIHPVQKPRGSYACSKLFSEFMLRAHTFPTVIVRFFNIVGPTQVPDYGHVLPRFIECAANNVTVPVYGSGRQVRSFCDIRDAVEMLILLIGNEHNGEIYNIGNDANICDVSTLAQEVIKVVGSKSFIEHIAFKDALGDQFEEIYIRYPNTDKINKYYTCKYNLQDIIKNIYETNFGNRRSS